MARPAADVAKGQPVAVQFRQMGAAQIGGARVMVALDPDPVAPGHQSDEPKAVIGVHAFGGGEIVKTVAKADHDARAGCLKISLKPQERGAGLIGGQERAAAPREAFGFAEMQV